MKLRLRIFLSLMLLAACSPAAASAPTDSISPDGQTIILWHSAEGDLRRALFNQIDEFNVTNPWRILVVPEYHGSEAELSAALQAALQRGRTPDLILGRPLDALRLGDAAVPVEPYVVDPTYGLTDADLADLYPAALDANRAPDRNDELVSFPVGSEGTVLIYNADRLASTGYLTPPNSWPLFREICLITTVDRDGDRRPDLFGLGFAPRAEFVVAWFLSRGAPLLTPDGKQPGFGGETGLKLLELVGEASQSECFYPTPGVHADLEEFSKGRVAMIFANTSDLRAIKLAVEQQGGFRWNVAPVPNGQLPVTLSVSGPSWVLLRSTPQKQLAAWLFARWFASTDQTAAWARQTGQLPLRISAADRLKNESADNPAYVAVLDLLKYGRANPLVAYWPDVAEAATRAVLAVADGDPADAVHAQALDTVKRLINP